MPPFNSAQKTIDKISQRVLKPAGAIVDPLLNNYDLDGLSSGDETDDEANPRQPVPAWAIGENLKRALVAQAHQYLLNAWPPQRAKKYPAIFAVREKTVDLNKMFPAELTGAPAKRVRRGSSEKWDTPPSIDVSSFMEDPKDTSKGLFNI